MLTDKVKNQFVIGFLETITGISNKEYQLRVWVRAEGPEVDDFDETCNFFFEDFRVISDNWKNFEITEKQYHILKQFHDEFEQYSRKEYREPIEFIDSPEWAKIMARAKEVLKAFNYQPS